MGIAAKKRGHAIAIQVLVVVLLAGGHADRELVLVLAVVLAVVGAAADVVAALVLRGRGLLVSVAARCAVSRVRLVMGESSWVCRVARQRLSAQAVLRIGSEEEQHLVLSA